MNFAAVSRISRLHVTVFVLVASTGCTTVPTYDQARRANYGEPVSREAFENTLRRKYGFFDPYSAVIRCTQPKKAWADQQYEARFGYLAQCTFNAKNQFGAYAGERTEAFLISDSTIFEASSGSWKYLEDFYQWP